VTPDLGTRLDTIATALEQVIIPALPADEVLALEQAALCIGQVVVLREQYRYLADYEALCLADMAALAGELVAAAAGGPETTAAAGALRDVVGSAGGPLPGSAAAGQQAGPSPGPSAGQPAGLPAGAGTSAGQQAGPSAGPSAGAGAGPAASATHRRRNAVASAVDVLLRASGVDGDPEFRAVSQRLVVAHGARQSTRDRAWFALCGMDPDAATLPSIPELVGEVAR
jgi:hypothetical protein